MSRTPEEIPIEISPPLKCEWRWLNTSALACQLCEEDALKPATRYELTIHPGIKAEDGSTIEKRYDHKFITKRPKIRYAWFDNWRSPGMPVIRATFNQPVSKDSVEKHLYMYQGYEPETRHPLKAEPDLQDHERPHILPLFQEGYSIDFGKRHPEKSDDDPRQIRGVQARRIWLVSPQKELPLDSYIELMIEPGLVSALGPEKGVTKRTVVAFHTFPEFEFIGVQGYTNNSKSKIVTPDDPDKFQVRFNPLNNYITRF